MPKILFLLLLVKLAAAQVAIRTCTLGDSSLQLHQTFFSPAHEGIYFINLHSNETTSIGAATEYLQKQGGSLLQLLHGEVRYVSFGFNNMHHKVDPNRIFTSAGIKHTLKKNGAYSTEAEKETQKFADSILALMAHPKLIIAMHNNTNNEFSVLSYTKGGNEAINAADVYVNTKMDADDFVYTTEQKVFSYLKQQKINAVLQKAKGFNDEGSLSIYCSRKHIPYINVEAQEGHMEQQLQMLNALKGIIASYE